MEKRPIKHYFSLIWFGLDPTLALLLLGLVFVGNFAEGVACFDFVNHNRRFVIAVFALGYSSMDEASAQYESQKFIHLVFR